MRPRRLELHGFTAFRDPQEVDFGALDLFVITGPTGAGKTSLLDAMALALYGQVPRMGRQGLGQLVSHGKAEARIMLEFGVDGDVYRVARRLPRSGTQQGRLERWDGDSWTDEVDRGGITPVNARILDLIKLDFESFCKAILLPQGEFARFLKGDPGERRKTLVALLGLGAYERMGALARERIKELRIRGEQTRAILAEQFADATPEALTKAQNTVAEAIQAAEIAGDRLRGAREYERARAAAVTKMTTAAGLAERFAALRADLSSGIEGCRAAETEYQDASSRREHASGSAESAGRERASAETQLTEVRQRTGSREDLARLIDAADRRTTIGQRVGEGERLLGIAAEARSERADEVERVVTGDAQARAAVEAARTAEAHASATSDRLANERDRLQRRLDEVIAAAAEHEAAEQEVGEREKDSVEGGATAAAARAGQAEAEAELEELQRDHLVAALVTDLQPGDPCPICERPLDQHPAVEPDVERRLADARDTLASSRKVAEAARQAAADSEARLRAARSRVARAIEALTTALGGAPDRAELEARTAQASDAARIAATALADAAGQREAMVAQAQAAAVALTKAHAELDAATREHQLRHENLAATVADQEAALGLLRARFGDDIPSDADQRLQMARSELVAAEERAEAARQAEAKARVSLAEADNAQRTALEAITAIDLRLGQLRARVEAALDELASTPEAPNVSNLPGPTEAREERASELAAWCGRATDELRWAAATFETAAAAAASELIALATLHASPAETPEAALASLEAAERDAVSARVRLQESEARLAQRVEQRTELESRVAADAAQIAVLEILATELRADHFTDFVVQETLDLLAVHASQELLRISDRRYSLSSAAGDFSVIDHVNADEERSVKTLSGGETFMASLSLALALSKHVSELAGEGLGAHLEAVFIDEGFGSLDPETLEEVIDALERLREDDLLIGVISHVPALAERIRSGLQVRKDGNRSTVLEAS